MTKKAKDCMLSALSTFEVRNAIYKDDYKNYGAVLLALFPRGIPEILTKGDASRLGILHMMVSKLSRYCNAWEQNHTDSVHDLGVYCFLMEELDHAANDAKGIDEEIPF